MPTFRDNIDVIEDGELVDAATANRPLGQLQDNDAYLKAVLDAMDAGTGLFDRAAAIASTVAVGQPVYYNTTNLRYELAVADDTAAEAVVGICATKDTTTSGDVLLNGRGTVDIAAALSGGLVYGRYWLSPTIAGRLVSTKPTPSVLVLYAGPDDVVWVLPQIRDLAGPQGATGAQGAQGSQGAQGYQGNQGYQGVGSALSTLSGTTIDTDATAVTLSVAAGVVGVGTIKNTGANGLTVREEVTDAFGTSSLLETNVAASAVLALKPMTALGTAYPPYTSYVLKVRSQTAGQPTTYSARLTRASS